MAGRSFIPADEVSSLSLRPHKLEWFPSGRAFQIDLPRRFMKKVAPLRPVMDVIVRCTDSGLMSRSEAVSMIPPVVLDVQPHHRVLDMCAAPGSKTGQLIEAVQAAELRCDPDTGIPLQPRGIVIANEMDARRAYLLASQGERVGSSALMVVTHDARQFPDLNNVAWRLPSDAKSALTANTLTRIVGRPEHGGLEPLTASASSSPSSSSAAATAASSSAAAAAATEAGPSHHDYFSVASDGTFFDRVLADVPCSGDGTIRKNVSVWREYSPQGGLALHMSQLQIAARGVQVLRVGGEMVYSTCTFNPIENEAVVSALLTWAQGSIELVDARERVPGLKCRPGISSWTFMDRDMHSWESIEDVEAELIARRKGRIRRRTATLSSQEATAPGSAASSAAAPGPPAADSAAGSGPDRSSTSERTLRKFTSSLFPPAASVAEAQGLHRCMRLLPQDGNSGGFFVCLFRKVKPTPTSLPSPNALGPFAATGGLIPDTAMATREDAAPLKGPGGATAAGQKRPEREEAGTAAGDAEPDASLSSKASRTEGQAEDAAGAAAQTKPEPAEAASSAPAASTKTTTSTSRAGANDDDNDDDDEDAADSVTGDASKTLGRRPGDPAWVGLRDEETLMRLPSPKDNMIVMQRAPGALIDAFVSAYGLADSFARDRLFLRNGSILTLYYHSPDMANYVLAPLDQSVSHQEAEVRRVRTRVKVVSAGVKIADLPNAFRHGDIALPASLPLLNYRPVQAGIHLLVPHLTKRVVDLAPATFLELLATTGGGRGKPWGIVSDACSAPFRPVVGAVLAETEAAAAAAAAAAPASAAASGSSPVPLVRPSSGAPNSNGSVVVRLDSAALIAMASAEDAAPSTQQLADASRRAHFIARTAFCVWATPASVLVHLKVDEALILRNTLAERGLGPAVDMSREVSVQRGRREDKD
jgi:16S rRNA C967 or C1407 C5-methylase (RsmB/RsmF family)